MSESAKLAIAGLISVTLRRKLNRVIDVEWMLNNDDYAREVMRIARKQDMPELTQYADRIEELIFGNAYSVPSAPIVQDMMRKPSAGSHVEGEAGIESQYIGALR
jgi:hypothetical protein